jgi:hypothetical protein
VRDGVYAQIWSQTAYEVTEEEARAAWERLMRHMGAQNLGYATGADNEGIDADLAREYSSSHEKEA